MRATVQQQQSTYPRTTPAAVSSWHMNLGTSRHPYLCLMVFRLHSGGSPSNTNLRRGLRAAEVHVYFNHKAHKSKVNVHTNGRNAVTEARRAFAQVSLLRAESGFHQCYAATSNVQQQPIASSAGLQQQIQLFNSRALRTRTIQRP